MGQCFYIFFLGIQCKAALCKEDVQLQGQEAKGFTYSCQLCKPRIAKLVPRGFARGMPVFFPILITECQRFILVEWLRAKQSFASRCISFARNLKQLSKKKRHFTKMNKSSVLQSKALHRKGTKKMQRARFGTQ